MVPPLGPAMLATLPANGTARSQIQGSSCTPAFVSSIWKSNLSETMRSDPPGVRAHKHVTTRTASSEADYKLKQQ